MTWKVSKGRKIPTKESFVSRRGQRCSISVAPASQCWSCCRVPILFLSAVLCADELEVIYANRNNLYVYESQQNLKRGLVERKTGLRPPPLPPPHPLIYYWWPSVWKVLSLWLSAWAVLLYAVLTVCVPFRVWCLEQDVTFDCIRSWSLSIYLEVVRGANF